MKRLQQNALLVGLVALALGACSSTKSDMASQTTSPSTTASDSSTSATAGAPAPDTGTPNASASMAGGSGSMAGTGSTSSSATGSTTMQDQTGYTPSPATVAANSIVTLIEIVPRQQANPTGSDTSGSGTSGTSGTSGSTAAGGSDKVYRVTLHMDDGSTRVITQEVMPTFRAGDRVRLENGMVLR